MSSRPRGKRDQSKTTSAGDSGSGEGKSGGKRSGRKKPEGKASRRAPRVSRPPVVVTDEPAPAKPAKPAPRPAARSAAKPAAPASRSAPASKPAPAAKTPTRGGRSGDRGAPAPAAPAPAPRERSAPAPAPRPAPRSSQPTQAPQPAAPRSQPPRSAAPAPQGRAPMPPQGGRPPQRQGQPAHQPQGQPQGRPAQPPMGAPRPQAPQGRGPGPQAPAPQGYGQHGHSQQQGPVRPPQGAPRPQGPAPAPGRGPAPVSGNGARMAPPSGRTPPVYPSQNLGPGVGPPISRAPQGGQPMGRGPAPQGRPPMPNQPGGQRPMGAPQGGRPGAPMPGPGQRPPQGYGQSQGQPGQRPPMPSGQQGRPMAPATGGRPPMQGQGGPGGGRPPAPRPPAPHGAPMAQPGQQPGQHGGQRAPMSRAPQPSAPPPPVPVHGTGYGQGPAGPGRGPQPGFVPHPHAPRPPAPPQGRGPGGPPPGGRPPQPRPEAPRDDRRGPQAPSREAYPSREGGRDRGPAPSRAPAPPTPAPRDDYEAPDDFDPRDEAEEPAPTPAPATVAGVSSSPDGTPKPFNPAAANDVFDQQTRFADLGLREEVLRGVTEAGFEHPTTIQARIIPTILSGRDVLGQAKTGTGKTAAFGLPMLSNIQPGNAFRAMVLVPTRELAIQVATDLNELGKYSGLKILPVYGGQNIRTQADKLAKGPEIIVATPGRVMDMRERGYLHFKNIQMVVLDEVDRMLDIGFRDDIRRILSGCPSDRQTVFVSATLPPEVEQLARSFARDAEKIVATTGSLTATMVRQFYLTVEPWDKKQLLLHLLTHESPALTLVFCRTKRTVDSVAEYLSRKGVDTMAIHGDMPQGKRNRVMEHLHAGKLTVLIASDLASRGLDVEGITHVINYDLPEDPDLYVHRIGRTARAGRDGVAWSLVTPEQGALLTDIEMLINAEIPKLDYPDFVPGPLPADVQASRELDAKRAQVAKSFNRFASTGPAAIGHLATASVTEADPSKFPGGVVPTRLPPKRLGGRVKTARSMKQAIAQTLLPGAAPKPPEPGRTDNPAAPADLPAGEGPIEGV